ncbi:MAG: shikimate dehydrogenase [Chloroflexi bacterium]|nr:shikimate dehydrogenase [Chloroflexota bacterium]MCL5076292.1 shikimate dehydrogenase [Chloroflexota bacterium]
MPIDAKTKVTGLIGYPVEHSLSPFIHNRAFAHLRLNYCYVVFPVPPVQLEAAIKGMHALGLVGVNVTIPHKEAVKPYLDELSPEATAIGAVNTIVVRDGRMIGYNTDALGCQRALAETGFDPQGKEVIVLGAGGAARAVVYALAQANSRITIFNRTIQRGEELARQFRSLFPAARLESCSLNERLLAERMATAALLINTTPLGMWPQTEASPLPWTGLLGPHLLVFDLVYNPRETLLLRQARQAGARTIGGLAMLIHQAASAFHLWTGVEPPLEVMYSACEED